MVRRRLLQCIYLQMFKKIDEEDHGHVINKWICKLVKDVGHHCGLLDFEDFELEDHEKGDAMIKQMSSIKAKSRKSKPADGGSDRLIADHTPLLKSKETAEKDLELMTESQGEYISRFKASVLDDRRTVQLLEKIMEKEPVDRVMMRSVNQVYLQLLRSSYWHQLGKNLTITDEQIELLLASVIFAESRCDEELHDLSYILRKLGISSNVQELLEQVETDDKSASKKELSHFLSAKGAQNNDLVVHSAIADSLLNHFGFSVAMMAVIVLNCGFVLYEEGSHSDGVRKPVAFTVIEAVFTFIFVIEFTIKFAAHRCQYFKSLANVLDFSLMLMSIATVIVDVIVLQSNHTGELQILRLNRILKVLRLVRLSRLIPLFWVVKGHMEGKTVVADLAEHLTNLNVLTAYYEAHSFAAEQYFAFFNGTDESSLDMSEEARALYNSYILMTTAKALSAHQAATIDHSIMKGVQSMQDIINEADRLADFVEHAHSAGVISEKEAHIFVHPLRDHEQKLRMLILDESHGVIHEELEEAGHELEEEEAEENAEKAVAELEMGKRTTAVSDSEVFRLDDTKDAKEDVAPQPKGSERLQWTLKTESDPRNIVQELRDMLDDRTRERDALQREVVERGDSVEIEENDQQSARSAKAKAKEVPYSSISGSWLGLCKSTCGEQVVDVGAQPVVAMKTRQVSDEV